jgi:hypothetical protein
MGINYAVTKGLDALGVNPIVTSVLGTFVTGGIHGGFSSQGLNFGFNMADGLKAGLQMGARTLLQSAGLDTQLSGILSLTTGPLTDGLWTGNVGGELMKIAPQLGSSLALYGIEKLGSQLGVDPRLTNLIGAPISAAIGQGIQTGNLFGRAVIQSIQDGLLRGALAYGVDFAARNITDNVILQALSSRVISGAIEGVFIQGGNLFKGVYEALKQSVLGAVGLGVDAYHFVSNAINFSSLVLQNGLSGALEIHLTSIFNRNTAESIYRSGGVASALLSPKQNVTLPDGSQARQTVLSTGEGILFDSNNNLIGFQRNGLYQTGQFGIGNDGSFGLRTGKSFGTLATGQYYEALIQDGKVTQVTTITTQGRLEIRPDNGTPSIRFDVDGNVSDGQIILGDQITLTIANGTLDGIQLLTDSAANGAALPIESARNFASNMNQIFLLKGPATTVYNQSNGLAPGVTAVDMKLDWFNFSQFLQADRAGVVSTDLLFLASTANRRWSLAIADAVPKTVQLIGDIANKFIFIPGVNSGVKIGSNDTGFTVDQINTLAGVFNVNGKRVMFAHSAGTG